MFRETFVRRRRWLTDEAFLDLLAATNLIPGPNSTEMATHIGFVRAGWPGLVAGALGFTLPATALVLGLSWLYVEYGSTPQAGWLLYGVKPVMIAIILQALWELGRKALKGYTAPALAAACMMLYFGGVNEVLLLFAGGAAMMLIKNRERLRGARSPAAFAALPILGGMAAAPVTFSLWTMFLTFLKIGAILYGSGYVLVAFLRADFVDRLGWITEAQLLDGIAIGQLTPGPLFTSATFIGYLLGGVPAALIATLGIFLPAYVFVALSRPFIPRLRQSPWAGALLDGVIVASLALMAAVTMQLGRASIIDVPTIVIFGAAAVLLMRFRAETTWLILGGALAGLATSLVM
jgi:chromate transporter